MSLKININKKEKDITTIKDTTETKDVLQHLGKFQERIILQYGI